VDAFGPLDAAPAAGDEGPYLPLQQDFAEPLARQLPDHAFHLQIKKRSQNFLKSSSRTVP